jgi:hypothetical protein
VVGFDHVVGAPVGDVSRRRREFVEHAWVNRRPVGDNLHRSRAASYRVGEEMPCGAAASRRVETSTSITWLCWSTAR